MPYKQFVDKPLHTVAFTAGFLAQATSEGVTEAEMEALVRVLATNPEAGDMIKGSGGCRKVRLPQGAAGRARQG